MGTLVAMKYPTTLFLKAADHTYVQCGNGGKVWGCWGGKTGGTPFHSGSGSTARADAIASSNERAEITCYLVNGVCHQAANRILLPANIIVNGARGYAVSSAIFGTYGKIGTKGRRCYAPFDQHPEVTGDLPICAGPPTLRGLENAIMPPALVKHLHDVRQAYSKLDIESIGATDSFQFQLNLFDQEVLFRLGEDIPDETVRGLRRAKEEAELRHQYMVGQFQNEAMPAVDFVKAFNDMTLTFQDDVATATNKTQYKKFFELDRDDRVLLALPEALEEAFGKGTAAAVYGNL